MRIISLLFVALCIFCFSCSTPEKASDKVKEKEVVAVDTVKEVWSIPEVKIPFIDLVDSLEKSIVQYKAAAFASEDKKVKATEELLKEIDQTAKSYFKNHFTEVKIALDSVKYYRYNEQSFSDLKTMENYDVQVTILKEYVARLVVGVDPKIENLQRANIFYQELKGQDEADFFIRKDYNLHAMSMNLFLEERKDELIALDSKYKTMKPYPLFYGDSDLQ